MWTSKAAIRSPFRANAAPNTDHTTNSGTKPSSGTEVITDTSFAPTLESAPLLRCVQSFFVLSLLITFASLGAWYVGFDIIQTTSQQWVVIGAATISLFYSGVIWIDWWIIVVEYWWLSIPALAGIGIVMLRMDEATRAIDEVD
ncbi:hypothetical protein TWF730_000024 [Orbilia blumenaviensis]|uniref:Uncharacterized protein n=1 Tax=Orbilia blumenaviensis TaxID=1796055 RepID=A0AAV9VLF6_9PEZI